MIVVILIVIAMLILIQAVSMFVYDMNFNRNSKSFGKFSFSINEKYKQAYLKQYVASEDTKDRFKGLTQEWSIISQDNLKLVGHFLKNDSHKYIIFCHGYTGRYYDLMNLAFEFYDKGFNCLMPEARGHGKSEGKYVGMGYLDRDDNKKWIDKIIEVDPEAQIALYGVSMGGYNVMATMCYYHPTNLKCVVEDSGYKSLLEQVEHISANNYKIKSDRIAKWASYMSKNLAHYSFEETDIRDAISKNVVPILFIHGSKDVTVPKENAIELYELNKGDKELLIVDDAEHLSSIVVEPYKYRKTLFGFIDKYISG